MTYASLLSVLPERRQGEEERRQDDTGLYDFSKLRMPRKGDAVVRRATLDMAAAENKRRAELTVTRIEIRLKADASIEIGRKGTVARVHGIDRTNLLSKAFEGVYEAPYHLSKQTAYDRFAQLRRAAVVEVSGYWYESGTDLLSLGEGASRLFNILDFKVVQKI